LIMSLERTKYNGYQYSEIIRNLANIYLSGGDVIEDINTYLGEHLKNIPGNNVPSADTMIAWYKRIINQKKQLYFQKRDIL